MTPLDGWLPGPNPFGNQRAQINETWYRQTSRGVYEVRYDFQRRGFVINKESVLQAATKISPGNSTWTMFSPVVFADPLGAMVWFALEDNTL